MGLGLAFRLGLVLGGGWRCRAGGGAGRGRRSVPVSRSLPGWNKQFWHGPTPDLQILLKVQAERTRERLRRPVPWASSAAFPSPEGRRRSVSARLCAALAAAAAGRELREYSCGVFPFEKLTDCFLEKGLRQNNLHISTKMKITF